jgi:hemolysin III
VRELKELLREGNHGDSVGQTMEPPGSEAALPFHRTPVSGLPHQSSRHPRESDELPGVPQSRHESAQPVHRAVKEGSGDSIRWHDHVLPGHPVSRGAARWPCRHVMPVTAPMSIREKASSVATTVESQCCQPPPEIIPQLRGWVHVGAAPLALAGGVVLVGLSPTGAAKTGSAVFATCALVLFSVSAAWHRHRWSPTVDLVFRRLDHSCIFLLIAGSYTPVALILLTGSARAALLAVVWGGAVLGIAFRLAWPRAPRRVYTPIYIALGWAAIPFARDVAHATTIVVVTLLALGGLLYTIGGIIYGLRRPNPSPEWFGYHEVFHLLTVVAFVAHYTAVSVASYALR